MMNRKHAAAVLCTLALAACATGNRYQLSEDKEGRLVRLDTQTGEVTLIQGEKLTPPVQTEPTTPEARTSPQESSPSEEVLLPEGGKVWPTLSMPQLGDTSARLTSYWHNGKLHYVLELYPFSKRLKLVYSGYYGNASLSLAVNDADGKQVAWTNLPTSRLKRTLNKAMNVEELSAEGVMPMSMADYDSLAGWQLVWNP
jgi:hypothetical protein